jgi:ribonuclease III
VEQKYLGALDQEAPEEFINRLGLPASALRIITRALTHRSYLNEHAEALQDNERLEFLGDAILDFLVGAWLYNNFPELAEGELTRLRSALVRTEQLAAFARQIKLGGALFLGRGEIQAGGRDREALLCAGFEALVGALYLDSGLQAVQVFFEPFLEPAADQIYSSRSDQDPKSLLQEKAQSMHLGTPTYATVGSSGPEHSKIFEVEVMVGGAILGRGTGLSKQAAAKAAASLALEKLETEN